MTRVAKPPQQDRGIRRVKRLLDAAAEEILIAGVDGLTMNAVAKRAATAAGSLYQFFPTRTALLAALADRYETSLATLATEVAERLRVERETSIGAAAVSFLQPFIDWYAANPAYHMLLEAMPRILPPEKVSDSQVAAALADTLRPHVAPRALARLDTAAQLMVEVGYAAISAGPRDDATARTMWLTENEKILSIYASSLTDPT